MHTEDKRNSNLFRYAFLTSVSEEKQRRKIRADSVLTEIPTGNIQIKFRRSIAKKTTLRGDCKTEDMPEIE
jgi:hypothetical protein